MKDRRSVAAIKERVPFGHVRPDGYLQRRAGVAGLGLELVGGFHEIGLSQGQLRLHRR